MPCSVTCGSGTRTRTRHCLYGRCVGKNNEKVSCYLRRCPSMILTINSYVLKRHDNNIVLSIIVYLDVANFSRLKHEI